MPNSATLVQTLLAAFCAILCACLSPLSGMGGGGMMLGARTAAWAKSGGWINPYVTGGLIAMWDGEWNAGGGVHSDDATDWIDLVSSTHSNPVSVMGGEWLPKSLHIPYRETSFANSYLIEKFGTAEEVTLEISLKSIEIANSLYGNFIKMFGGSGCESGFSVGRTAENGRIGISMYGLHQKLVSLDEAGTSDSVSCNLSCRFNNLDVKGSYNGFLNGVKKLHWIFAHNPSTTEPQFCFYNNQVRHDFEIYSIRFYVKMLSDAEIAANYAIDKARFGLT